MESLNGFPQQQTMAVYLVSTDSHVHQGSKKTFSCLEQDTSMLALVKRYHTPNHGHGSGSDVVKNRNAALPLEHIKVVCGNGPGMNTATGQDPAVSGADLEKVTVGQLSHMFAVNHFRIVCVAQPQAQPQEASDTVSDSLRKAHGLMLLQYQLCIISWNTYSWLAAFTFYI